MNEQHIPTFKAVKDGEGVSVTVKPTQSQMTQFQEPDYITEWNPQIFSSTAFKSMNGLDEVCGVLMDQVGGSFGRKDSHRKREQCVWALVGSLHDCVVQERPLAIYRTTTSYKKSKRYNHKWFTCRVVVDVSDTLEELGFIEMRKGYLDVNTNEGHITKVYATPELLKLFAIHAPIEFTATGNELVLIKDGDKKLMEYTDTAFTTGKRDFLVRFNEFMDEYVAMHDGRRLNTPLFSSHSRGSFNLHGRYYNYAGGAQSLSGAEREEIIFNHPDWERPESAYEYDYSSLHPNLIYSIENIDPDMDDLYLPVCVLLGTEDIRGAVKLMLLMMINAKTIAGALKAYRWELSKAKYGNTPKQHKLQQLQKHMDVAGLSPEDLIEPIKKVHARIAHWFGSDAGIRLMWHDSEIMRVVLEECLNRNIPTLPIHDSVVVPARFKSIIQDIMNSTYLNHVSTLSISEEYTQINPTI